MHARILANSNELTSSGKGGRRNGRDEVDEGDAKSNARHGRMSTQEITGRGSRDPGQCLVDVSADDHGAARRLRKIVRFQISCVPRIEMILCKPVGSPFRSFRRGQLLQWRCSEASSVLGVSWRAGKSQLQPGLKVGLATSLKRRD